MRARSASTAVGVLVAALVFAHARSTVVAQAPPPFGVARVSHANDLWGDGADRLFVAAGPDRLLELHRGAAAQRHNAMRSVDRVDGRGIGVRVTLVAVGGNELGRYESGRWSVTALPGQDFAVDVSLAADGTAYVATARSGLHIAPASSPIRTLPYPGGFEGTRVLATAGGRVFVSGDSRVLELANGAFVTAPFLVANPLPARLHYNALWQSPSTQHLWIGCDQRVLLEVDLASNLLRQHVAPLFGEIRQIAQVPGAAGERLLLAAQSELGFFEAGRFALGAGQVVFATGLYADALRETVYAASSDGVRWFRVENAQAPLPAVTTDVP